MRESYSCHKHGKTYKQEYQENNKANKYLLPNTMETKYCLWQFLHLQQNNYLFIFKVNQIGGFTKHRKFSMNHGLRLQESQY